MKMYRGVVENNNDPKKLGRAQVRIFGLHTENNENSSEVFNFIKTSELPWAEIMGGTAFGLISGVGVSSVLRNGTWVWVILQDDDPNLPIVIGTIIGENTENSSGKYLSGSGFCDPDGIFPKSDRLNRTDMHPNLDSKYLTLSTLETPSGHLIELDDTLTEEKIKITHKIGTSIEITNDLIKAFHVLGSNIEINNDSIKAIHKLGSNIEINNDIIKITHKSGSYVNIDASGNITWQSVGNLVMNINGTTTINSSGNMDLNAPRIDLN